ncbi:restriction endonuclease [Bacillus alkalicola]|uniref:Restriction endonuclease n=2 Tax=Bacillales TaxID=1385 RepID=A0ABS6JR02_9BACI|nr:restriction endonuclease [Bacillus alkalicola]MBU9720965.1 restriction endonuclease [Bacillus alkalicola]
MTGIQFEYYLKLFFQQQGYRVDETKTTGDFGADLVLSKKESRIIVQAKRYKNRVGIKAIQEAVSAVAHYRAKEAWVVTNSEFTAAAMELARSNKVKLIEREELMKMILELNGEEPTHLVASTKEAEDVGEIKLICKRCGDVLIKRKSSRGEFYGCKSFPKCRYKENIS